MPCLHKHPRQRLAAVALILVVGTNVESVDVRAMAAQQLLKVVLDPLHIGRRIESQRDSALIRNHDDPQPGSIQARNGFGRSSQQAKLSPRGYVAPLRHLLVQHPIPVEKDRPQGA